MSDSVAVPAAPVEESKGDNLVAILLAMAMFVLVVDTSLMNVSISAVVRDLDTTASGVQSAIALEALVSAAFILRRQDRRPDRPQARVHPRPPGLRGRCALDDGLAEPDPDHHLLGGHRRARSLIPAPVDAV